MNDPTDNVRRDRAVGAVLASAAGDALGAPHEFGPALDPALELSMTGGGSFGWEPGEWTDDTQTSLAVLAPLAEVLTGAALLLEVGEGLLAWMRERTSWMWATRPELSWARRHRPLGSLSEVAAGWRPAIRTRRATGA